MPLLSWILVIVPAPPPYSASVVAGEYLELLNGVDRGIDVHVGVAVVDHGDAIDVDLGPDHLAAIGIDAAAICRWRSGCPGW